MTYRSQICLIDPIVIGTDTRPKHDSLVETVFIFELFNFIVKFSICASLYSIIETLAPGSNTERIFWFQLLCLF